VVEWIAAAKTALATGAPAALISVLATEGSAPRGAGTRMLVTADQVGGTIGGGALEQQAIAQGRAALAHPAGSWRAQDYPLGPLLGQCCGGRVRLLVERLDPAASHWIGENGVVEVAFSDGAITRRLLEPSNPVTRAPARGPQVAAGDVLVERLGRRILPVYLFGAGHVGRAVARTVEHLPLSLAWFDSREEEASAPGVTYIDEDALPGCLADAPSDAAILIMTHDHALDYRLTGRALQSPVGFVGLIGSDTKRARFLSRLAKDGIDASRLNCPIGVEGVVGKDPAIIAIAVAAQLMQIYGEAA